MEKVDDLYLSVAQNMVQNIKRTWDIAKIQVEVFDDAIKLKGGSYEKDIFTSFKFRDFNRKIISDFENIHQITTFESENNWNRAQFTLEPTGKFKMDFEWDQELADEIERLNND